MQFLETAELDLDLGAMGIKTHLPVLDRFSPLSYCIALYVHWSLASHRGAESCARISLETVHIMQGQGLYQELGEDCIPCKIKRKKFIEVAFGPVQQVQLTMAAPMFYCEICSVLISCLSRARSTRPDPPKLWKAMS